MLFPNFITIFATSTDVYDAAFASLMRKNINKKKQINNHKTT